MDPDIQVEAIRLLEEYHANRLVDSRCQTDSTLDTILQPDNLESPTVMEHPTDPLDSMAQTPDALQVSGPDRPTSIKIEYFPDIEEITFDLRPTTRTRTKTSCCILS